MPPLIHSPPWLHAPAFTAALGPAPLCPGILALPAVCLALSSSRLQGLSLSPSSSAWRSTPQTPSPAVLRQHPCPGAWPSSWCLPYPEHLTFIRVGPLSPPEREPFGQVQGPPRPSRHSLMGLHELRLEPRRTFAEARTTASEQRGRAAGGPWSWSGWMRAVHGALGGWGLRGAACTRPTQAPGCVLRVALHRLQAGSTPRSSPPGPPRQRCAFALLSVGSSWGQSTLSRGCSYVLGLPRACQLVQLTGRGAHAGPG